MNVFPLISAIYFLQAPFLCFVFTMQTWIIKGTLSHPPFSLVTLFEVAVDINPMGMIVDLIWI